MPRGEFLGHQRDSGASHRQVRQGACCAVADLEGTVVGGHALVEIPEQRSVGEFEPAAVAGVVVEVGEQQRRAGPTVEQSRPADVARRRGQRQCVGQLVAKVAGAFAEFAVAPATGEVQQVQRDSGQAGAETVVAGLRDERLGAVEQCVRFVVVAEILQHVGGSVRAVQETGAGRLCSANRVDQPALVLRVAAHSRDIQCVQDTRRTIAETDTSDSELLDVAGKQPVVAFGCRGAEDRFGEALAGHTPVRIGLVEFGCGDDGVRGAQFVADRVAVAGRERESAFDHVDESGQFARFELQQRNHRQEDPELQRGERVAVDGDAGAVLGCAETRRSERGT